MSGFDQEQIPVTQTQPKGRNFCELLQLKFVNYVTTETWLFLQRVAPGDYWKECEMVKLIMIILQLFYFLQEIAGSFFSGSPCFEC